MEQKPIHPSKENKIQQEPIRKKEKIGKNRNNLKESLNLKDD